MYLIPLVLIVASVKKDSGVGWLTTHPLEGPDGGIRIVRMGTT